MFKEDILAPGLAVVIIIFALCCLVAVTVNAPLPVTLHPNDSFALLDGGWRHFAGQTAYRDFHSPLGPLVYVLISASICIFGPTVAVLTYVSVFFSLMLGLISYPFLKRRFGHSISACIFSVFTIIIVTPRVPDNSGNVNLSHAMLYNRWGDALLLVLCLVLFFQPRHGQAEEKKYLRIFFLSCLLFIVFSIKANYFLLALGSLALFNLGNIRSVAAAIETLTALTCSFLLFSLASLIFNFSALGYFADLWQVSQVQLSDIRIRFFKTNLFAATEVFSAYLLLLLIAAAGRNVRAAMLPAGFIAAGIFLAFSNSGEGEQILLSMLLPFIVGLNLKEHGKGAFLEQPGPGSLLMASSVFIFAVLIRCTVVIFSLATLDKSGFHKVDAHTAEPWLIADRQYVSYLHSGGELLQSAGASLTEPVFVMDFTDPFSFLMQRKPAKGALAWWHYGMTFDKKVYPDIKKILCDTGWILFPLNPPLRYERDLLRRLMAAPMSRFFKEHSKNTKWILYQRIGSAGDPMKCSPV